MKKAFGLLIIGFILVLTACSSRLSGDTTTVCTLAPSSTMAIVEDVTTTIIGSDEDLVRWTERFTVNVAQYETYFFGMPGIFMDDADIEEWFAGFGDPVEMGGQTWHLVSIDGDVLTLEVVYHYDTMTDAQANEFWEGSFRQVTVTSAIGGLEEQGANCTTN